MTTTEARILLRRDTATNWTSANPTLAAGELGFETDTERFKIGDGSTPWTTLAYEGALAPNGTKASPNTISSVAGISILGLQREVQFVRSASGAVTISANPQIEAGTQLGQELLLFGTSNTNYITLADASGLSLNGSCPLKAGSSLYLVWDGTLWSEVSRNDI